MADPTVEKSPTAGTSVNRPKSGTYGEKADVKKLEASLPPMGPGQATPGLEPSPMPQPSPGAERRGMRPGTGRSTVPTVRS